VKFDMATMSRFKIHDEDSAPEAARPILKSALRGGGQLPNFLGVLGGAPAALRGYVRLRGELRQHSLPAGTVERIALAAANAHHAAPDLTHHSRAARAAGVGLDEIMRAQRWSSQDQAQAALLAFLKPLALHKGEVAVDVHEAAREAGWTEEQLIEAIAVLALESFVAMVDVAGDVPLDATSEGTRQLKAVA
jgi:AhpD family alkylhydroperoxidase